MSFRGVRYACAVLFGVLALGVALLPLAPTLRGDSGRATPGQWLFEAALGVPLLMVAVLLWPKKHERQRRAE